MMTLRTRVNEAFEYRKTLSSSRGSPTKQALAAASQISAASVSQWFSGESKHIRGQALHGAAEYLGVSPGWLATGTGSMLPADNTAEPYRLTPLHQATIDALTEALRLNKLSDVDCLDLMRAWLAK